MAKKSSYTMWSKKDTQNMVRCGTYLKWQHFACTKVTRDIEGKPYLCVTYAASDEENNGSRQRDGASNLRHNRLCYVCLESTLTESM